MGSVLYDNALARNHDDKMMDCNELLCIRSLMGQQSIVEWILCADNNTNITIPQKLICHTDNLKNGLHVCMVIYPEWLDSSNFTI
jgi:hypothetical protein